MNNGLIVRAWRPWRISIDRLGPFRESIERVRFVCDNGKLSNLYMLAAGNGRGKTTILEAVYFAMRMLAPDFPSGSDLAHDFALEPDGKIQLDLVVELESNQRTRTILLSISWNVAGGSGIGGWDQSPLEDGVADFWLRYGWTTPWGGSAQRAELPLPQKQELHGWDSIDEATHWLNDLTKSIAAGYLFEWPGFNQTTSSLPTVLYFSSGRDILRHSNQDHVLGRPSTPRFQCAHRFDREGSAWLASLDNLMVWYYWVSKADFSSACEFINSMVFYKTPNKRIKDEPERDPPRMLVINGGSAHPVDRLSSGEKTLVQFALRVGAHRTTNTILLLDELELHLHPDFQRRVMRFLMDFAAANRGVHVIFTTHSFEVMKEFRFEVEEKDLHKGGEVLL